MKKLVLILPVLILLSLKSDKQPKVVFKDLSNMIFARMGLITATDNSFIYLAGGGTTDTVSENKGKIQKYDIANNMWSVLITSQNVIRKVFASSVIIDNNLYIFNGATKTGQNNKLEIVDLKTGAVTFSTDNPAPTSSGGASVYNGIIYVFGGANSRKEPITYSNSLYKYDPSFKVWTKLADMPEAKETKGEIIDGKLYVFGGYNGKPSQSIDMYDIQTNTWKNIGKLPTPISGHSTSVFETKIYMIGDYKNLTNLSYYDVSTNKYNGIESNMIGRRHAGSQIINGKLYIMGGNQTPTSDLSSIQVADLTIENK